MATYTQAEMILIAIYRVASGTTNRVPFESIVIQVWRDFPPHFSLSNHPEYPDSYSVSKRLYSDLITKRLVVSLRKQVYRLTSKGLRLAQQLEETKSKIKDSPIPVSWLHTDEEEFLQHALRSRTYLAWKQGKGKDLINYDARVFFQFSTGTPVKERKRKVENAKEAIEKAVINGLPDGSSLHSLFEFLVGKFPELFEEV